MITASVEDRLWSKVIRHPTDCWIFTGCDNGYGYGLLQVGRAALKAHRLAYESANGPIPPGSLVCHTCDNRKCVRPSHLFLGTHADNNADMIQKGRAVYPKGEKHGCAKLTEDQVRVIRAHRGRGLTALAKGYGISYCTIKFIRSGRLWKHLL